MTKYSLAFLGLGVMGYPMAGHLARAGHRVTVYNRTTAKAEKWLKKFPGEMALSADVAAQNADFVFACVGNDQDVRDITTGEKGAFRTMQAGAIFIDHTTASADLAKELASKARNIGLEFIDAPVSGGQAGAENGVLTIMAGGDQDAFNRSEPLMNLFAQSVRLMGESGSGQLTKMVNQICIAGLVQSLSEGVAFAINAGLDCNSVFDVLSKGAASSWQMINRNKTMVAGEFEFGFAVDWMRKDLGLCFTEAKRNGSDLPVAKLVDSYYAEIQQKGGNRYDTSSLITKLPKKKS